MIRMFIGFLRSIEHAIETGPGHSKGIVRRAALMLGVVFSTYIGFSFIHPEPVASRNGLSISHPWSKGGVLVQQSFLIYLTIENKGGVADQLLHIESPMATDVTITAGARSEGILSTRRLESLEIQPRDRVVLRPGQIAITLESVNAAIQPGEYVPISLLFARAGKLEARVRVESPGEPEHADHF